jgi:multiple sugar transport system permease protein
MMPPIGSVLSLFLLIKALGLSGTYLSLIFIYVSFQAPFVIWLMRGFFASIPREMEESAMIDGCSRLEAFLRLIIPLSAPGLAATSVFVFTLSWNEFLFALIFTSDQTKTVPVVVPELITEMGIYWGEISALGVIVIIPIAVFVFLTQKNLIKGLTFGAVKQ